PARGVVPFPYAPRTGGRMTVTIGRRELLAALGGAAVAWPLAARAQQAAMPGIGYLSGATFETMREYVAAFRRGLADEGFFEGRNVAIEYRWAENYDDRLPALATDLVRRQPAVIAASTTPSALALKEATQTVPIVFVVGTEPVKIGLVARLAQPGGNITGVTVLNVELIAKSLELGAYRRVGFNSGRILKGEKAADLPVEQATKIEMAVNLKIAKALGLTIPLPLLGRADEVIE